MMREMTADEIAKAVGLHHNGVWLVDEIKFRCAIVYARGGLRPEVEITDLVRGVKSPLHHRG